MVRSSKGFRSGTRRKMAKGRRDKFSVERFVRSFEEGQKVVIKHLPSSHKGMPHPRFKGLSGVVKGKRGDSYIVSAKVGRSMKTVISRPEHLKAVG